MPVHLPARRALCGALLVLGFGPMPVAGQAAPRPGEGAQVLAQLAHFLTTSGKAASITDDRATTYTATLPAHGGCTATLRTDIRRATTPSAVEVDLTLSALSPDVGQTPWKGEPLVSVGLQTTSGAEELIQHVTEVGDRTRATDGVSLVLTDSATADTAAQLLRRAILACGGQPRSPAVAAAGAAKTAAAQARVDTIMGHTMSPADRAGILSACQHAIRGQLRAPSLAQFAADATVLPKAKTTDGWIVFGKVEAQTAIGSMKQSTYTCLVDRFGKQFVPSNALLM